MSQQDWDNILKHKENIINGTVAIDSTWCVDDVLRLAKEIEREITEAQAKEVLILINRWFNAETGTNWDIISHLIIEVSS